MTILQKLKQFESLNTDAIIDEVMEGSADTMADYNARQLFSGDRSDGSEISPSYRNPDYAASKNRQNPTPGFGTPDLRLTGAFYKGLYVTVIGDTITYGSTDTKADKLEQKYGKGIYGLNTPFKNEVIRETIWPGLKEKIETGLSLKMSL